MPIVSRFAQDAPYRLTALPPAYSETPFQPWQEPPRRGNIPAPFPKRISMAVTYDLIVIGGGHNGLVTAAYAGPAGTQGARARASRGARRRLRHRRALARVQGLHRRLRQQPAAARDHPRPGAQAARLRDAAAEPVVVHAVPRRALAAARSRQGDDASRGLASSRRKDADALPRYEAMLERVADFLEPTLMMTPPNPWSLRPGEPDPARQDGARVPEAGARRPEGGRDPRRRGHPDPRPLVRVGAAQGDARDRRDHRRDGLALDAGHGLRAVPPRDGRVRRRARRVGLRARRHGRHQQRDRRGGAGEGRRDPHQRRGRRRSW